MSMQTKFVFADFEGYLVGIDEVGRGPLAGPVVAAAVILDPDCKIDGLADSKMLNSARRSALAEQIYERALAVGIGRAEVEEIDCVNILQASLLAMQSAVNALTVSPVHALVDGNCCPQLHCTAEAVVGGDGLVPAISAASIVAKVYRDAEMVGLHDDYPHYGFSDNKGYPTAAHIKALRTYGVTPVHRRSFKPVADCIKS